VADVNRFVFAKQRKAASYILSFQLTWLVVRKLEAALYRCGTTGADSVLGISIHLLSIRKRRDCIAKAKMKLRLHRKYSIKLMLAWESCRFESLLPFLLTYD
jgi:hypothetical protein